jgi:hypothetical protein
MLIKTGLLNVVALKVRAAVFGSMRFRSLTFQSCQSEGEMPGPPHAPGRNQRLGT